MDKKPVLIWILIAFWIVIGILFIVILVDHIFDSGCYRIVTGETLCDHNAMIIVSAVAIIISFILAYLTIFKIKWSWNIGLVFSFILSISQATPA